MRLLLDSHVFLWWLRDDRRLSRRARAAIAAPRASVMVSSASVWEIAIKLSLGRLQWKDDPPLALDESIVACGFTELPVTAHHAAAVRMLPHHHGDPFDRLLIAQASAEGLRVATADDVFSAYGVAILPAGG